MLASPKTLLDSARQETREFGPKESERWSAGPAEVKLDSSSGAVRDVALHRTTLGLREAASDLKSTSARVAGLRCGCAVRSADCRRGRPLPGARLREPDSREGGSQRLPGRAEIGLRGGQGADAPARRHRDARRPGGSSDWMDSEPPFSVGSGLVRRNQRVTPSPQRGIRKGGIRPSNHLTVTLKSLEIYVMGRMPLFGTPFGARRKRVGPRWDRSHPRGTACHVLESSSSAAIEESDIGWG